MLVITPHGLSVFAPTPGRIIVCEARRWPVWRGTLPGFAEGAVELPCPLYPRERTCAVHQLMSALGHKRTHAAQQKGSLFDDLIGGDQQARWNCQAKRLRRFAVDDSFELRRRLHRKVSGFCTAQDAVDKGCPLSRQIDEVSPVIHETARCDENTDRVNCGQAMLGC